MGGGGGLWWFGLDHHFTKIRNKVTKTSFNCVSFIFYLYLVFSVFLYNPLAFLRFRKSVG